MKLRGSLFSISRFGLIAYVFFIVSILFMSTLIPYGDEPDFEIRYERLQNEEISKFDLHHYVNFFPQLGQGEDCIYESGSKSILAKISPECIALNLSVVPYKLFHVLFITAPIFFLVVFRKQAYRLFFSSTNESFIDWERKVDATILGILLPSAVYAFSFVSQEVFSYSLLFLLLIISRSPFWVSLLLLWIFLLDFGAFLVAGTFISSLVFFLAIRKKISLVAVFWCAGILIFFSYIIGEELLIYLAGINIQSKFSEVQNAISSKEAYENYPLIIRPVIAVLSLSFMTASGIKSIALYLFWAILAIYFMFRLYHFCGLKKNAHLSSRSYKWFSEKTSQAVIGFLGMVTTIFCIVLIAPTHTNAKYYIFMLPFAVYPLLYLFNRYILLFVILFSSILLYLNIVIFYML